jgi:predicted nucleotidyltransferase
MGQLLIQRRNEAASRILKLQSELKNAEIECQGKACVYVTGSVARGEATPHSDLDIFIVSKGTVSEPDLKRLDEILLKADLIQTVRKLGYPPFSGDGEYLTRHIITELISALGQPHDDVNNTFTARLLLLLESKPLLGKEVYDQVIEDVIAAYWKDYPDHKDDFQPAFLANDILRMWRTFCVNYEARNQSIPARKKAKRKLRNYKLKHSRLLTCYSALLYLLAVFVEKDTVSPEDVKGMVSYTPTERIEWLLKSARWSAAQNSLHELIERYEEFLRSTDYPEEEIISRLLDPQSGFSLKFDNRFGDLIRDAMQGIGGGNRFHRMLIV